MTTQQQLDNGTLPTDHPTLYLVGHIVAGKNWRVCGVFTTKEAAEAECLDEFHFVGPVKLNQPIHSDGIPWADAYFPRADKE